MSSHQHKKNNRNILKYFLFTLLGLVIILFSAGIVLLKWPGLVINESVLYKLTQEYGPKFGIKLTWEQAHIQVSSKKLLNKQVALSFNDLCFDLFSKQYHGCIKKLEINGRVAWQGGRFKVLTLGPILVENATAHLNLTESAKKEPETFSFEDLIPEITVPDFLSTTRFKGIKVSFDSLKIKQEEKLLFAGSLLITGEPDKKNKLNEIGLVVTASESNYLKSGQLNAQLKSDSAFTKSDWQLLVTTHLALENTSKLAGEINVTSQNKKDHSIKLKVKLEEPKVKGGLELAGKLNPDGLTTRFSANLKGLRPEIKNIVLKQCLLDLKKLGEATKQVRLSLDCPAKIDLDKLQLPDAAWKKYFIVPLQASFKIKTDLETRLSFSLDQPVTGQLEVELDTIAQHLLNLDGKTLTKFSGIPNQYPKGWDLVTKTNINLLLNDFQRLKKLLDHSAFAIWAPANVLKGTAEINIDGYVDIAKTKGSIPIEFNTRFNSKEQRFDTDGAGVLNYELNTKDSLTDFKMDLLLSDLKIALPSIKVSSTTALPALFPDKRFYKTKKQKAVAPPSETFNYQITIKTPIEKPAHLASNLARTDIPLDLDIILTPEKLDGSIKIKETQFEVFRRIAELKKLEVDLANPTEKSAVNGIIGISYADYDISLLIVGAIEAPNIIFQSDPPLSREEIISILIYGRTFDELDEENSNSVSSVSAALADRVLALGSLYFLASTPIENIGYDAESGEISARFKLRDGSSLTLGTQKGETQKAGFRQKIKGNWSINSFLENNSETGEQSAGALLEWYKRY